MIYYPLSTLMLAGIREILVITTPHESDQFKRLLGDGSQWGVALSYAVQPNPDGLAQSLIIGEEFISGQPVALILGDNIFFGAGMGTSLERMNFLTGSCIFASEVNDPRSYGVVEIDEKGKPASLEEKPLIPKSRLAVTGLYFFDQDAAEIAKRMIPSARGELEITEVALDYLKREALKVELLTPDQTWLDAGTIDSLYDATTRVYEIEKRIGKKINVPEEVAWRKGFIDDNQLLESAKRYPSSGYGEYIFSLLGKA
jgi:glucose-1-phosphate thymidylyltransferase